MNCTCPHLKLGLETLESKNWNPDCPEHGIHSEWYNSEEVTERREKDRERTVKLQKLASMRRRGEISQEESRKLLAEIDSNQENSN